MTGSGKTTTAARVSELLGIPWTNVDDLTWDPGWTVVPQEIQKRRIREICSGDSWILDSAYGNWIDIPLERVQLVISLDYSRGRSFWQLLKRTVSRSITKEQVCNGNIESFKAMFSKDSLLLWHYKSFHRKRERIHQWAKEGKFSVKVFKNPRELSQWLHGIA